MTRATAIVCLVAVGVASRTFASGAQSRDTGPLATASVSGTVLVAGAERPPARRVRVTLTDLAGMSPGRTTTTDDRGGFVFAGLGAGRFELQAFKPGYLRSSYGASRPERAGTPVVVTAGEAVTNLSMTIARGGVITGVVRNARGRPMAGTDVHVLKIGYNAVTGERTLVAPGSGSSATADDRGEYRAYGLPPGSYLVLVPGLATGRSGGPGVDDIRPLTSSEVRQALQAARSDRPGAAPVAIPPVLASSGARLTYAPVFHPGVTDIAGAATIALGIGEERRGVDIAIQLVPTATITGTISAPSGALPAGLSVRLVPAGPFTEMLAGAGIRGATTMPRPDGTYVLGGVAPGTYLVKAEVGRGRGAPAPDAPTLGAVSEITVNGHDLDVPLTLTPGISIRGRVGFQGTAPTPAELQSLTVRLLPLGSGGALLSSGGGRVDAEGRFTFASVAPNTYQFLTMWSTPGAGERWTITASTINGRDAFEEPLRVRPNENLDWTVTLTDRPAVLAGVFQDRNGRAATDHYILVFSSDRRHWTPGTRRLRMTRPATDGAFSVRGLPPGEYLLAALADLETGEWNDPALLDQLVPSAVRITLRDGETTRQDFRIGGR
jgi:hypothetical protein